MPTPTPTPTPTPSSSRRPFAADDPGTWTVSSTEVGPIALGAPYDGEIDDLPSAYTLDPNENCPNPAVSFWFRQGSAPLVVSETDGVVTGVTVGLAASTDPALLLTSPTTAKGIGDGSTLDELKAAYPGIALIGNAIGQSDGTGVFDLWSLRDGAHSITFELGADGVHVGLVWVGSDPRPPTEYCG